MPTDSSPTPEPAPSTPPSTTDGAAPPDVFALPERARQIEPGFGWTAYAEVMNGRFAMLGFIALLVIELVTRQDFFTWLGLR
ncbi:MAG: chlorophyll a/b-binding protein [Cyanobacteria bacterium P01_A01_bin.135]